MDKELVRIQKRNVKRLKEDVLDGYRLMMSELYKQYRMMSAEEVRLYALEAISSHVCEQTRTAVVRAAKRSKKAKLANPDPAIPVSAPVDAPVAANVAAPVCQELDF